MTKRNKQPVNARIRAIDKNLFEKSDGDIRALIVDLDVRDLLRIVIDDEKIRQEVDIDDYSKLKDHGVLPDAFEDNVRIYLRQRSKINRNIKETALSDDAHRFFYFNNGITITCSFFDYPKQRRSPIIELQNLQVVNGGQTIHALFDAFKEDRSKFDSMDVLCRIYETRNENLSTDIAEYTNSQNPVNSRDIRSNDYIQKKLEVDLKSLGYFYERKKSQYSGEAKEKRIDAEKAGQTLLTFFGKMPAEAKDKKRLIFADKYDDIFTDQTTGESVLLAIFLFDRIEDKRTEQKQQILRSSDHEDSSYIFYASYYILYVLSELAEIRCIDRIYENREEIFSMYDEAINLIKSAVRAEKEKLKDYRESYSHRTFFKSKKPILYLQNSFEELAKNKS